MTRNTPKYPSKISVFLGINLQTMAAIFVARATIDLSTRMLFPFIPQLSSGLQLTVVGFSWLLFTRSIMGVLGPVFGMLSDRYGRRNLMASALFFQAVSTAGMLFFKSWWTLLPITIAGLSVVAFFPSAQAYINEQAYPQRRGRAMSIIESSWSLTGIFLLPVVGWMIDRFNWQAPFMLVGLLSLISAGIVWLQLPPVPQRQASERFTWAQTKATLLKSNVLATVGTSLLLFIPLSALITIWGVWLATDFQIGPVTIGLIATGIGVAEFSGVGLSSLLIDQVGKKRSSIIGIASLLVMFMVLPMGRTNASAAITILVAMSISYEFAIVSLIPLYAEQVPEAKGTVLSMVALGTGIGGAIGAPLATILWQQYGLWAICGVAIVSLSTAIWLIARFLHD